MRAVLGSKVVVWAITQATIMLLLFNQPSTSYQYSLRADPPPFNLQPGVSTFRDVTDQIVQRYTNVEKRWAGIRPPGLGESSPPASTEDASRLEFTHVAQARGAVQERSDFTANLQPGAPPFSVGPGPPSSADPLRGGNFCDEGAPYQRCVVHQPLRFPGNYTISGAGTVPFSQTVECTCDQLAAAGCSCAADFKGFLPTWAVLSWARVTTTVEQGAVDTMVQSTTVDGTLVQVIPGPKTLVPRP